MNVTMQRGNFNLAMSDSHTGLFGHSGAGKSTVLGLIAGTIRPERGHIVLDGKTVYDSRKGVWVPREQRPVGAVLQADTSLAEGTVKNLLDSAYERTLRSRRWIRPNRLVELLELEPVLDRPIAEVSAGERQRAALGRALLKSPRILLLDEPFAAVDWQARTQLKPLLKRVEKELNLPLLYASHSLPEILELARWLIVVAEGKILSCGSLTELARSAELAPYLRSKPVENVLEATLTSHDETGGCSLARAYGVELVLPYRPQLAIGSRIQVSIASADIALSKYYLAGISMQNQLAGRICALIETGGNILVQVDCGATLLAGITPRACREMDLQEGDRIYCLAKTQSFNYADEIRIPAEEFGKGFQANYDCQGTA